jgi:squalene-hopene/tetraprenyl-beta-curcumene cyclase
MAPVDPVRLRRAYETARAALLSERTSDGHWVGELSTSALSTAVACSALSLVQKRAAHEVSERSHASAEEDRLLRARLAPLIEGGLQWLAAHQNADGGWGDTVKSLSNISTTMLCRAAFSICGAADRFSDALTKSEAWLTEHYGRTPEQLAEAVRQRYGKDRTFSVPILMTSALAGLVSWKEVPSLPFELACFPQWGYRFLGLPVVSYALPALIAIGQAVHHHRPPWDPLRRLVRWAAVGPSLRVLTRIQPSNGGFLEAAPLTAFVALGLASAGKADHPVVRKCVEFLVASVRPDGSWPIDTNLATWVTTLSVNALATAGDLGMLDKKEELLAWLLAQQYRERHPFTGADPGAWAWTPLPGGVPDADDTPGALLAIRHLAGPGVDAATEKALRRVYGSIKFVEMDGAGTRVPLMKASDLPGDPALHVLAGMRWLGDLQNRDGGWPTFCRGWGKLPFDRSGSDLTAHALRAQHAWIQNSLAARVIDVIDRSVNLGASVPTRHSFERWAGPALRYLAREQRPDGSWLPLWFGNQHAPDDVNPTYGTARVLAAYRDLGLMDSQPARRGVAWLLANQNDDSGWGGQRGTPSSTEETALAVEILLDAGQDVKETAERGIAWLVERVEAGTWREASPIGFYFAKLWYFEKLYPIVFTVAALGRAVQACSPAEAGDKIGEPTRQEE